MMRITQEELHDLVVDTVRRFAGGGMERRRIIDRVEERVRRRGAWEPSDDAWSRSTDSKNIGRAAIDWAISDLKRDGRLESLGRNRWVVAAQHPQRKPRGAKLLTDVLGWVATHPDVLDKAKAIADNDARQEFFIEEYYAWDMR
jgi:GNAT superfamily N-acetyltransferase